ncbi:MAG: CRTAC1 family protein, partial [Abitibacteriaceae bacterium]|nr:CRTAC1 family protein [Abditibacteriaceae bacterium]
DYDNDGWPDIFIANGHIDDNIGKVNHGIEYAERPLLFHNEVGVKFREVGLESGAAMSHKTVARGLAYADIDLDGDLDVAISTCGYPATLLRNDGGNKHNSIRLILQGTKSNRSAIGAQVEAQVGSATLRRTVRSGSSYCSQSELPITLGLGQERKAQSITIHWPSGATTSLKEIPSQQIITINEAKGVIRSQPFPHH